MATPSRRETLFPGSSTVLGKRFVRDEDVTNNSSRLSASQVPKVPDFLSNKRHEAPPALPVKVNPHSQRFAINGRFSRPNPPLSRGPVYHRSNPWESYYPILDENQAGRVTIAHKNDPKHPIVVIKQRACAEEARLKKIFRSDHKNVVLLIETYYYNQNLYFVYESMDVSLAEIQSTPYGIFEEFHIATVCKEVINPWLKYSTLPKLTF